MCIFSWSFWFKLTASERDNNECYENRSSYSGKIDSLVNFDAGLQNGSKEENR